MKLTSDIAFFPFTISLFTKLVIFVGVIQRAINDRKTIPLMVIFYWAR